MDWKTIIAELQQLGYTQPDIAKKCHCAQPTISDLAQGKTTEPRYSLGQALGKLHRQAMAKAARQKAAKVKGDTQ